MDSMIIKGGAVLNGSVATSGAKNADLPLLFASLLADGEHSFENVPFLNDIDSTELLLNHLNCETYRDGEQFKVLVKKPESIVAPYDIVRKMRASILCLGPLLARYGEAKVSLPGGCAIGAPASKRHHKWSTKPSPGCARVCRQASHRRRLPCVMFRNKFVINWSMNPIRARC